VTLAGMLIRGGITVPSTIQASRQKTVQLIVAMMFVLLKKKSDKRIARCTLTISFFALTVDVLTMIIKLSANGVEKNYDI